MVDVKKLLVDVFDPQPEEIATVMVDLPPGGGEDNKDWQERREMAERWRSVLDELGRERGFKVNPMLTFPATGANNSDLPANGFMADKEVVLSEVLLASTLVIAMTEYSATAPLSLLSESKEDLRMASMPGVQVRMEETALAADYGEVARRCRVIAESMHGAELCDVLFSTGHRCWFDLRHRHPDVDDGQLPRFKAGERLINLPSGETYEVPYEGEVEGVPSQTAGTIPVIEEGETVLFHLVANRVQVVEGEGPVADRYRAFFADDPARTNIAEVAFGVNELAVVTGSVIEDEKAGFHWAFGRSDHLGGIFGVDRFRSPATVVHQDIVYAKGNPVQVRRAAVIHPDGRVNEIISDGEYVI